MLDGISRGRARKQILVRPPRFLGERLEGLGPIEVPGYGPIRLEVYLRSSADTQNTDRGLGLYSVGTLVAESFQDLGALDLNRAPWTDPRLTGIVEFSDFKVAPGSRRGILPDDAATAFSSALRTLEPALTKILESLEQQRLAQQDRTLIRDLQMALKDFHRRRPRYAMLHVSEPRDLATNEDATNATDSGASAETEAPESVEPPHVFDVPLPLLPPGPLTSLRLTPSVIRLERDQSRKVLAEALDENGRRIDGPVTFQWSVMDVEVRILSHDGNDADGTDRALIQALGELGEGSLRVIARSEGREARAEATLIVTDDLPGKGGDEGVPRPEFIDEPGAAWRSRMQDGRWQVNTAHADFRGIHDQPTLKLRYLAMLFAKEVVQQSHNDLRLAEPLEQLVEVAAYADRRLSARKGGRRAKGVAQD
jgi:hypothetical protein